MRKYTFIIALFCGISVLFAQNEKELQKAKEMYKNFAYVDAIKIYESIAKKGFVNQDILENLGNSYYYNAEYKKALPWYKQLFENKKYKIKPEYYYRYAQVLKSVGKYDEANKLMSQFAELTGNNDTRAVLYEENKDYREVIESNSGRLQLHPVAINTEYSEYGTAFYGNNIVYATSKGGILKKRADWTGDNFYSLYEATTDSLQVFKKGKLNGINTKFNESTAAFSKDGNTVYFTRNNFIHNEVKTNGDETVLLKIFKATKNKSGKWEDVKEMPFNSNIHSVAHPALSPDGKYIYFASDMKGTIGASDIYRAKILKNGYGKPENLGALINTQGRESFPFVSDDNILYYSSDGFPGLGGLDIYAVKLDEEGNPISKPVNVGRPANSAEDDFCYVINTHTKIGYLTSNRPGGKGSDDIYSFYEEAPVQFSCKQAINGIVKNAKSLEVIADAKITLLDKSLKLIEEQISNKEGTFSFLYTSNCKDEQLIIKTIREGFSSDEQNITLTGLKDAYAEVLLSPIVEKKPIKIGDDLSKELKIDNIYFDYDKANIRPDAAEQLAKIVKVMEEYPTMKIDVRLHTDSRGSDSYNLALSQRRAKSTIKWLIAHGIHKDRITGKGYGETQLVNGCSNGVPCTEEQHQANRRSEFIIISM